MKKISIPLENEIVEVNVPDNTEILSILPPKSLDDPAFSIQRALIDSIDSPGLDQIIEKKLCF